MLMALLNLEETLPVCLTDGLAEAPASPAQIDISPASRAIWRAVETAALDLSLRQLHYEKTGQQNSGRVAQHFSKSV